MLVFYFAGTRTNKEATEKAKCATYFGELLVKSLESPDVGLDKEGSAIVVLVAIAEKP